jgi:hypothetical protein
MVWAFRSFEAIPDKWTAVQDRRVLLSANDDFRWPAKAGVADFSGKIMTNAESENTIQSEVISL